MSLLRNDITAAFLLNKAPQEIAQAGLIPLPLVPGISVYFEVVCDIPFIFPQRYLKRNFAACEAFSQTKKSAQFDDDAFSKLREQYNIGGLCAVNPLIEFQGNLFCFTGISATANRNDIAQ